MRLFLAAGRSFMSRAFRSWVVFIACLVTGAGALATVARPAVAASAGTAGTAAPTAARAASCAQVLFFGARGSGEPGPGTPGTKWTPTKSDPYGIGARVGSAQARFAKDVAPYRSIQVQSLDYPAYSTNYLEHVPSGIAKYLAGLAAGVRAALADLTKDAVKCPDQEIVLAGYSQGAMAMHRVLNFLYATKALSKQSRAILSRIAAADLIADGDQVRHDRITRYGTAPLSAEGVGVAFADISGSGTGTFNSKLGVPVLSVCDNHDPVCAWGGSDIKCLLSATCRKALFAIHGGYTGTKPVLAAADQAARDVLAGTWSAGKLIDSTGASLTGISCPTAAFCMAVDSGGKVLTYSGGTWSGPRPVASGNYLAGVSCASASFCAAITDGATAYVDNHGAWSSQSLAGADGNPANLTAVSCPAVGRCVATGDLDAYTYSSGSGWAQGVVVQDNFALTAISCASAAFCLAADNDGNVYAYSGGHWTGAKAIDAGSDLTSVSCPTAAFCAVTSAGATAYIDSHGAWSARNLVGADGNPANLTAVSCPAAGLCTANGDWDGYRYSVGAWARGILVQDNTTFAALSCPAVYVCRAVDNAGHVYTFTQK
jgi:hypothetical protein